MAKKVAKKTVKRKSGTKKKDVQVVKSLKEVKEKKKMGRPAIYTEELITEFFLRMIETNKGIHTICKAKDMPSIRTVFDWMNDEKKDFSQRYARAKELQAERLRDELIEIGDECIEGTKTITKNGKKITIKGDMVERAKLKADIRKFLIGKLGPKYWGNKTHLTHEHIEQPLFPD